MAATKVQAPDQEVANALLKKLLRILSDYEDKKLFSNLADWVYSDVMQIPARNFIVAYFVKALVENRNLKGLEILLEDLDTYEEGWILDLNVESVNDLMQTLVGVLINKDNKPDDDLEELITKVMSVVPEEAFAALRAANVDADTMDKIVLQMIKIIKDC